LVTTDAARADEECDGDGDDVDADNLKGQTPRQEWPEWQMIGWISF